MGQALGWDRLLAATSVAGFPALSWQTKALLTICCCSDLLRLRTHLTPPTLAEQISPLACQGPPYSGVTQPPSPTPTALGTKASGGPRQAAVLGGGLP